MPDSERSQQEMEYILGEGMTDVASIHADQVVTYTTSGYIDTEEEKPPENEE